MLSARRNPAKWPSDRTAAQRQRWHRQRQRTGKIAFTLYFRDDFCAALIERGLIAEKDAQDKRLLADRLGNIIESLLFP